MAFSRVRAGLLAAVFFSIAVSVPVSAQTVSMPGQAALTPSLLSSQNAGLNVSRRSVLKPFVEESVNNLNLGMLFSPARGVDLRADAWRLEVDPQFPAAAVMPQALIASGNPGTSRLFIDDSNLYTGRLEAPSVKSTLSPGQQAQGIDLSASYVWESPRFGQFIVSTKATYLYGAAGSDNVLDGKMLSASESALLPKGTDLQSSLMLTWQVGKHTATAVTHYFDSFEELSKMNMEQLNELVGNMTTLDLQYGYNMKTGRQGEAVFSLGVRNLFDAGSGQSRNKIPGAIEQNGRVAYGTIKYQF